MADERAIYEIELKDSFSKGLGKIDRGVDSFEKGVDRATKKSSNAFDTLKKNLVGLGLAAGAGLLVKNVAKLGIEMEQTRVSFTTFLGSAEKANKAISDLNEFSNVTPFQNDQVIKAGKGLLAFGVSQQKLIPTLKKIGDISAGTGKDFNELAVIYGKARVAGTLYAEDINQLVEAGVPIMGEFAKALGTTEDQVKKMASEGKLKFKDLETAFTNLTSEGGMFFDLMRNQSETVGGKISTLIGKFQTLGITIGEQLIKPLSPLLDSLIDQFSTLTEKVDGLRGGMTSDVNSFVDLRNKVLSLSKEYQQIKLTPGFDQKELDKVRNQLIDLVPSAAEFNAKGVISGINLEQVTKSIFMQQDLIKGGIKNTVAEMERSLVGLDKQIAQKRIDIAAESELERTMGATGGALRMSKDLLKLETDRLQVSKTLAKSRVDLNKIERIGIIQRLSGDTGGSLAASNAPLETVAPKSKSSNVSSSISGSSPKNVTMNIGNLIENVSFTGNVEKGVKEMNDLIKRTLLEALNDVQIVTQ